MEEFTNVHYVALWGFGVAVVFGFVANKTHFCAMGAISDVLHMGSAGRMGAWFLAIGVAVVGAQVLHLLDYVDLSQSRHLTLNFAWLNYLVGGVLFGIGMTLAAGCGQRNLVRFGAGNLKALVVLVFLGITAYMTMRGLLALVRVNLEGLSVDLSGSGLPDQGIASFIAAAIGLQSSTTIQVVVAGFVGIGCIAWALKQQPLRESVDNLLAGVVIGGAVVAAWYLTGFVGQDDFDPITTEGISFIASTANAVNYLMTFSGSTINFGVALVVGTIVGSFLYAVLSGTFRIETFSNRAEMVSHLIGAMLMGFGGVLALGCTIGQGVTGLSTLAVGSVIALVSIIFGSALTMKTQYHLLDDKKFLPATGAAFLDLLIPSRREAM